MLETVVRTCNGVGRCASMSLQIRGGCLGALRWEWDRDGDGDEDGDRNRVGSEEFCVRVVEYISFGRGGEETL